MVDVERRLVVDDGERVVQQLGHAGPDRLHGGQGPRDALREALVVGSQAPVMAYGRQRGHVDHGAQLRPAALADRCAARVLAAFPSRRLQAGERH